MPSAVAQRRAPSSLKGHAQPRIFTPPLKPLEPRSATTEKRTLGYAVLDFASEVLQLELYPWQKWLLVHALELSPDGDHFRFRNVVVLVARQNGKSTLSQVLSLFFMYVLGTMLVIGTAQDLDVAEEIWQGAVDLVEETPQLDAAKEKVIRVNGQKTLKLITGERYKVKAANRKAGRGLSGDLILLDELREHQTWDAWGAITKTTMARPNAQVWCMSNAGDITSIVLRYLRKMAHSALGDPDGICAQDDPTTLLPTDDDPAAEAGFDVGEDYELDDLEVDDDSLGLFEWSAPPNCSVWDPEGWRHANPSLGYSITTRALASSAKTDPEWVFRTECLCQWSEGTLEGPFPVGSWDRGTYVGDDPPQIVSAVKAGVGCSADGTMSYVAVAGWAEDGILQVEIAARRAGKRWVQDWLTDRVADGTIEEITGQGRGSQESPMLEEMDMAGLPIVKLQGPDLPMATTGMFDAVRDGSFRHLPWPELDAAAATAVTRKLDGGAVVFDSVRSPLDIGALRAAMGALWLATRPQPEPETSVYETRGVQTI